MCHFQVLLAQDKWWLQLWKPFMPCKTVLGPCPPSPQPHLDTLPAQPHKLSFSPFPSAAQIIHPCFQPPIHLLRLTLSATRFHSAVPGTQPHTALSDLYSWDGPEGWGQPHQAGGTSSQPSSLSHSQLPPSAHPGMEFTARRCYQRGF